MCDHRCGQEEIWEKVGFSRKPFPFVLMKQAGSSGTSGLLFSSSLGLLLSALAVQCPPADPCYVPSSPPPTRQALRAAQPHLRKESRAWADALAIAHIT